jgi:hypothetical protein
MIVPGCLSPVLQCMAMHGIKFFGLATSCERSVSHNISHGFSVQSHSIPSTCISWVRCSSCPSFAPHAHICRSIVVGEEREKLVIDLFLTE